MKKKDPLPHKLIIRYYNLTEIYECSVLELNFNKTFDIVYQKIQLDIFIPANMYY